MEFLKDKFRKDMKIHRVITLEVSLTNASEQIGISKATLSRIENGKGLDVETFGRCCAWLNISASFYFDLTTKPRPTFHSNIPPQRFG